MVISILNMTLSHDKVEDENFCPLKDEECCPGTILSQGKAIYPVLGQNPYPGKWLYPVYTWDDFLKNSVGFRQTLHGEESCGNA